MHALKKSKKNIIANCWSQLDQSYMNTRIACRHNNTSRNPVPKMRALPLILTLFIPTLLFNRQTVHNQGLTLMRKSRVYILK